MHKSKAAPGRSSDFILPPSFVRRFADAWIGGGWHTMLAAAGLAVDAGVRFGFPWQKTLAFTALNGGGALTLYGGRYAIRMLRGGDGEREQALRGDPPFALFSCFAGLVFACCGMLALPFAYALWTACWGAVALAYCYPLTGKPWREYGLFKPFLLALCWTAVTCGPPESPGYLLLFAARGVWLTGLGLAFDAKDVEKDRLQGVLTPAVRWGEKKLWPAVFALLTAGLFAKLVIVPPFLRGPTLLAWVVTLLMLAHIRRTRSTRAWVVWGDGMMIVYALAPVASLAFAR